MDLWRGLSGIRGARENIAESMESVLQRHGLCRNSIEKVRNRIEAINEEIGSDDKKDLTNVESVREKIIKDISINESKRETLILQNEMLAEDLGKFQLQKEKLEKDENLKNELSKRADLAGRAYVALDKIFNEFTAEIKEKIALEANSFLEQLLDDEGRETLKKIVVNDDYSLQILDKWGRPFLANISAGQRQVMSIAFISALAKVAAGDSILEMPLFMDTPFGRLSLEHRKKLIVNIPSNCAQWILLATDTEFRKQEAGLLKAGGRWGKFYQLKSGGAGITTIHERNLIDVDLILMEEKGAPQ
jgi:DNA sulfur modification protein DndD